MRKLIIDGDATPQSCMLCQSGASSAHIRVRERVKGGSEEVGHICPTCIFRMFHKALVLRMFRWASAPVRRLFGLPQQAGLTETVHARFDIVLPLGDGKHLKG
jgi:hypothetical protein